MHPVLAIKLHLTAAALGCDSRKALCARFRAVNPATRCEVERLHKWMQGRASPRGISFYEDWRRVVGSERSAAWFRESAAEPFLAELAHATGLAPEEVRARATGGLRSPARPPMAGAASTLHGAFACYSHAWSPHFRGKLIRGALRIGPGRGGGAAATYDETLISGPRRLSGEVTPGNGAVHVVLRGDGGPLLLSVIAPGPPASALCGILAGPALIAHAPMPSASRLVAVRVPEGPALDATNRYMEAEAAAVLADLLGLGLDLPGAAGAGVIEFLSPGPTQVALIDELLVCDLLDPAHLGAGK